MNSAYQQVKWKLYGEACTEMIETNTLVYWVLAWSRDVESHAFKYINVNGHDLTKDNWKGLFLIMGLPVEHIEHYPSGSPKFTYK